MARLALLNTAYSRASPWRRGVVAFACATVSCVALAAEPNTTRRIVSLAPHATELLFSAGAGSSVVAVTESCDKPAEVVRLPKVSGFRGTNVEAVVALKPDIVIAWPSGNRSTDIEAIRRFGLNVQLSELSSLASITGEVRKFSEWAANADLRSAALRRAQEEDQHVELLKRKFANARKVRVFYQLGKGRLFTLTDKHVIGEALSVCGAENVFGRLALPAPEVSTEAVLSARPDAILLADAAALSEIKKQWGVHRLFGDASADARIRTVDGARLHRPTLATFDALEAMCKTIDEIRSTLR